VPTSQPEYTVDDLTIVGIVEIAELLNVKPRTPHAWKFRDLLPAYDYPSVNGTEAWKRKTILRWAVTGPLRGSKNRCPANLYDEAIAACTPGERAALDALQSEVAA